MFESIVETVMSSQFALPAFVGLLVAVNNLIVYKMMSRSHEKQMENLNEASLAALTMSEEKAQSLRAIIYAFDFGGFKLDGQRMREESNEFEKL